MAGRFLEISINCFVLHANAELRLADVKLRSRFTQLPFPRNTCAGRGTQTAVRVLGFLLFFFSDLIVFSSNKPTCINGAPGKGGWGCWSCDIICRDNKRPEKIIRNVPDVYYIFGDFMRSSPAGDGVVQKWGKYRRFNRTTRCQKSSKTTRSIAR